MANGGGIRIVRAGKELEIKSERAVRLDRFQIVEPTLDRWNPAKPQPEETDFEPFTAIRGLRKVWLRTLRLPDASFAILANNPDLAFINLEDHAALRDPSAVALAKLPQATTLDLTGSGLTDAGLVSLAAAPRLRQLTVRGTKAMSAGLAAFAQAAPKCRAEQK